MQVADLHGSIYDGDRRVTVGVRMPAAKQLHSQPRKNIEFNRVQHQVAALQQRSDVSDWLFIS